MDIPNPIDFILHVDEHLAELVQWAGPWTIVVIALIVFAETGLVVMPLLPGDSLLFAAGTLAALGGMNVGLLMVTLFVAAVAGDAVNYWVGHRYGRRVAQRFINPAHLERTERFFEKHGGRAVVLARFVPIVRTIAPFVAGMGAMHYGRFVRFNVLGAALWVIPFVGAGYLFGNIPVVKDNFGLVILAIIAISLLPMVWEYVKARREARAGRPAAGSVTQGSHGPHEPNVTRRVREG